MFGCACGKKQGSENENRSATNQAKTEACIDSTKINKEGMCIEVYEPVCGCNNKTYSNSCYAEKEGVTKWVNGECKK